MSPLAWAVFIVGLGLIAAYFTIGDLLREYWDHKELKEREVEALERLAGIDDPEEAEQ